jgi:hypothetical protein
MGTGNKQAQPTNQTITQTNLPAYAKPYFTDLLKRGQAASYQDYVPYEGQRIAGFSPDQQQAMQGVTGLQAPGQFGTATGLATTAGLGALTAGQYTPGQFISPMTASGTATTGSFVDPGTASQFMSPYMQNVVDVQKAEAIRDAQKGQLAQNLAAPRMGTYGGARQLLATTERERSLGQQLGQIQATGSQSAYDAAQRAFEAEQGRGLQAQQLNMQTGLQSQMANQQAMMEAQRMAEQSRQFGGSLGLQGLSQAMQGAQTLGDLGSAQQQSDLQRLQAQLGIGSQEQALDQQRLDTAYGDFLRQRDYPMEMLGYYSNLLQGLLMQMGSTQTTYAQPPSFGAQLAGAGLGALGMYQLAR